MSTNQAFPFPVGNDGDDVSETGVDATREVGDDDDVVIDDDANDDMVNSAEADRVGADGDDEG